MIKQNKTKILYIITKSNWGGAQKYVFDLATSLSKDKFDVIVAFGGTGLLQKKLQKENIRTIQIKNLNRDVSVLKDIKVFFELLSIYKKERPDITHLNSSKIGIAGSLAGRLSGIKKIIFTAHGWAFNEKQRNILSRFIIWKLSVFTSILCTDIIVLSKKEQKQAQYFPFVFNKKIHLIRNGLKEYSILPKDVARQKLNLKQSKTYIGTISELHTNKGLSTLIKIAPDIDADIVIIGSGSMKKELNDLAKQLKVSAKIHFLGSIENAGSYLKAFNIFTLTSTKEGLPYVLLEASYANLPIVASNIGGIPEIIIDNQTGYLVAPNSPKEVSEKIQFLLKNPTQANTLSNNAKIHIKNNFSFESTKKLTLDIYFS